MKNYLRIFLFLLILSSCENKIDYRPKYENFKNDWERDNLNGRIKTIELFKASVENLTSGETGEPVIQQKKEYNKNGNILIEHNYDYFGSLVATIQNKYNSDNNKIESVTENYSIPSTFIEQYIFDSTGNLISTHATIDDTIQIDALFYYDSKNNIVKAIRIQEGDTTSNNFQYKLNENNKVVSKTQIQTVGEEKYEYLNSYKYDNNGNLTELFVKSSEFGNSKEVREFDSDNRIKKTTKYQNDKVQTVLEYDEYYNQTIYKSYNDGVISKDMKFEYEHDKKGNWIKKDAYVKDLSNKSDEFIKVYTETRKIEYYE